MRAVCVFCGSSPGRGEGYVAAAEALAEELAGRGLRLVYGGAAKGTMGRLADAMLAAGGKAVGVIPRALRDKEIAHEGLDELHVVASMHERKALMAELSDAFIALPGGFGTLEEIVEIQTWGQLAFHDKPCGLLNVAGYYDDLLRFLEHAEREAFLRREHREALLVDASPARLLDRFSDWQPPRIGKWRD